MVYSVVIERGKDFGYVVHYPAIPGCHCQGNTVEEAIENIRDPVKGCLSRVDEDLISERKELASINIAV